MGVSAMSGVTPRFSRSGRGRPPEEPPAEAQNGGLIVQKRSVAAALKWSRKADVHRASELALVPILLGYKALNKYILGL